jgi:hypothetical protein
MFKVDVFKEVAEALGISSIKDLKQQIKTMYSTVEDILEVVHNPATRPPLYLFVDEIQGTTIGSTSRMGEFVSDDGKTKRSLLRPMWLTLTQILDSTKMRVILSGTGIDWMALQNALTSSVFKFFPYKLWRNIGAFDDPDAQKQYIEQYLKVEQSAAREAFLERAWAWCRGRYFPESSC